MAWKSQNIVSKKKKAKKTSKWEDSPCPQIGKLNSKTSLFPKVTYGFIGISIKIPTSSES